MVINNLSILNFSNNCIDNNKPGVRNWIHVSNTDPPSPVTDSHKLSLVEIILVL